MTPYKPFLTCILAFVCFGPLSAQAQNQKPSNKELEKYIEDAKLDIEIVIGSSKNNPGLGNTKGTPDGTELKLPSCIKIVQRKNIKFVPDERKLFGASQSFYVALSVVNTCCNKAIEVNLPPGMMVTSNAGELQNGLLVENVYFTVPPSACNSIPDTTTIYVGVVCLNEGKSPPMDDPKQPDYNLGYHYTIGKITNDANLLKLLKVISNKPGLTLKKFVTNDPETIPETLQEKKYSEIQKAIYKITEGRGITRGELKKLEAFLMKTD